MTRRLIPLLLALAAAARAGGTVPAVVEAKTGHATLLRYGEQRVLVVRGTPRERGRAHGAVLAGAVRANTRAFLEEWAIGRMGRTREELQAIWDALSPHVPPWIHEELAGLAEGSGVPLADLRLLHAIPSRYHCTGTAALPSVTADGRVYHTRSLDYALDIGTTTRPQDHALLLVTVPQDDAQVAHAVVGWAGFLGCVTGLNAAGVSVGEMGSRSRDESYDGKPMIFLLREVLATARGLDAAKALFAAGPRTCGYNFIACDASDAVAIECNRSTIRFFGAGDPAEAVAPHFPIPGVLRRCNHFVDPDLAATQRDGYDPRESARASWSAYELQGRLLAEASGRIDARTMIGVLRSYPAVHPCLHQAVLCPTDRSLWVSQAHDPAADPLPGAQNQAFLRYDLGALVAGETPPAEVDAAGAGAEGVRTGLCPDAPPIEGFFAHEPAPFPWRLEELRTLGGVSIAHLSYPSPGPSRFPENRMVHAEYYRPAGEGPFPAVVVLHIADGRFYVARLIATTLAGRGVAALFVQLPYYGDRRPAEAIDPATLGLDDLRGAVRQAVRDIRRGAAWLRGRDEVDPARVGIAGVSLGAFAAELAAGADGGFDRCVFALGGGSLVDTLFSGAREVRAVRAVVEARGWTRERLAAELAAVEPLALAGRIDGSRVLMINCTEDEVVPPACTRAYRDALGDPEIVWYPGGHYAVKDHAFEVLARIADHFARPAGR